MSSKIRVQPAPGRRVRLEDGRLMPPEGWTVDDNAIWRRRLRDGDVELVPPAVATKPEKSA